MLIEYWADYICPWCYLATDRIRYLVERHGAEVMWHPFELHPEIPAEGDTAPPLRRSRETKMWLRDELASAGLPITRRATWSNSRRALALSAWAASSTGWPALHDGIYHAYWAQGRDIGDPLVLADIATVAGFDAAAVAEAIADGSGRQTVADSRDRALSLGIGTTPGWLLPGGVVFSGVHEREVFDRVVARSRGRR